MELLCVLGDDGLSDATDGEVRANWAPVRRGVGLFLMATAIEFSHPRTGATTRISCNEAPRFKQVLTLTIILVII